MKKGLAMRVALFSFDFLDKAFKLCYTYSTENG